jgi:hypothetical protein
VAEAIGSFLWYLIQVAGITLFQIFILLGPILILAFIMSLLAEFVEFLAFQVIGRIWFLLLFGWLGTTVHELGHIVFCLIFGHRIVEANFFNLDLSSNMRGLVRHSYNLDSLYQRIGNFFIGIGPIILGPLTIFLTARFLLGVNMMAPFDDITLENVSFDSFGGIVDLALRLLQATLMGLIGIFNWQNLLDWRFYAFLYITFAVGSSVTLSLPDIEGAFSGFSLLVITIFLFNFLTFWLEDFATGPFLQISRYLASFYMIMIFAIILNVVAVGILFLILFVSPRK